VTDPDRRIAMQFDQKILGKLTNPLYRVALGLLDGERKEVYRLVDPRTSLPDRLLGAGPSEWVVFQGERPVAKVAPLPRRKQPAAGLFGALRSWLAGSDPGVVSFGPEHLFPAPVALGLLMIFNEVVDVPAG
jgi:hypothetical protein